MKITSAKVLHYPRLDTIIMVEKAVCEAEEYPNKMQLWKALPKSMMYQTFELILDYLEHSGKIVICPNGSIIWTWNPKLLKKAVSIK